MNNGTLANATLACTSFDSLTDLLGQVQSQNLNITIQIQQCPDLCGLAWGAGNPDLSGIGVDSNPDLGAPMSIRLHTRIRRQQAVLIFHCCSQ